jgi:hypothetical protein
MNDFIVQSEAAQVVKNECKGWNTHGETMANLTGNTKRYLSDRKPIEFFDRRRGFMTMFNNCPYCGEKINWREIKKAI